jgi:Tfp pilus assembly protein PilO
MNRNTTAVILIILAIGIYFTVTKSIIVQAKAVKKVNDQYTSAIKNAEQLIKVREQVLKSYNSITAEDRERLEKMLPGTVDNIRLVIDLTNIGTKHGMNLKNVQATAAKSSAPTTPATQVTNVPRAARPPEGTIPTPTLDSVTVSFSVTAPYLEFISFLQDIESNLRIMDISKLSVTATETGQYDFQVELKTYWLRQQ